MKATSQSITKETIQPVLESTVVSQLLKNCHEILHRFTRELVTFVETEVFHRDVRLSDKMSVELRSYVLEHRL